MTDKCLSFGSPCTSRIQNSAYIHKELHNKCPPKAGFCYNRFTMNSNIKQIFGRYLSSENLTFTILTVLLALTPIFFVPSFFVSFSFAKSILASVGTVIALVSYLIILIKKGHFDFHKSPVVLALGILSLVYLVASIFSNSSIGSFLGYGFEIGTFSSILLMSVLAYLVSVSFIDSKKLFAANFIFLIVSGILAVFQTILILFGLHSLPFLSSGGFINFIVNTIGKTSELGVFFGVSALMSLTALEVLRLSKVYRNILHLILLLSLFVIVVANFLTVWYVLGFVVLMFFIYQMTFLNTVASRMTVVTSTAGSPETRLQPPRRKIAGRTLSVAIIALIFILPIGRDLAQSLTVRFKVDNFEVRPSLSATYEIFEKTIKSSPVLGSGPNRFSTQWQLHRPDVNLSNFWNINFDYGIGFMPTAFVETGVLGILAWVAFVLSILYVGFRALSVRSTDQMTRYFVISSFVATLFLWVMNVVYIPSPTIFALSFFFTGLLIASAAMIGVGNRVSTPFLGRPKASFIIVTLSVCVLIGSIGLGYVLFERGRASVYFQEGARILNSNGDISKAESLILRALTLSKNDIYYRASADLNILKMNNLIAAATGKSEVSETERNEFQNALTGAVESARMAERRDPSNFENQAIVAKVYGTIIPVQVAGAYETSKAKYEEALKLSPKNPALFLALARVETANNNLSAAEEFIKKSLELKWNYPDAFFLQSQIDVAKGNLPAAIKSVEQIAVIAPNDPLIYFRLGLIKYEAKNFTGAVGAFEKSISLVPVYANAKYFLGLSYARNGRLSDAILQFNDLKSTNPENREIDAILGNLEAGRDPFADAVSPADSNPEKRKELPLSENN